MSKFKRFAKSPVAVFLLVFLLGFGFMNLFSLILEYPHDIPQLYDYKAATIGDGFFLPLLIAASYYHVKLHENLTAKQKKISLGLGAMAFCIGVCIQVSWLLNDNINPNWTIPSPHSFNLAGWYHATMFGFFFFFVALLLTQIWFTHHNIAMLNVQDFEKSEKKEFQSLLSYFFVWLSGAGFLNMLILDNYFKGNEGNSINALMGFAIIYILISIFFTWTSFKKFIHNYIVCLISAALTMTGFAACFTVTFHWKVIFAFIMILLSVMFVVPDTHKKLITIYYCLIIILPMCTLSPPLVLCKSSFIYFLFVFLGVLLIASGQYHQERKIDKKIKLYLLIGTLCFFTVYCVSYFYDYYESAGTIVNAAVCLILSKLAHQIIEKDFNFIIQSEKERTDVKLSKRLIFPLIISVTLGAIIFLCITISTFIDIKKVESLLLPLALNQDTYIYAFLFIGVIVAICFSSNLSRHLKSVFIPILSLSAYILLAGTFWSFKHPIFFQPNKILLLMYISTYFMILGSATMIAMGYGSNIVKLRGQTYDFLTIFSNIIVFSGTLLNVFVIVFPGALPDGRQSPSLLLIIASIIHTMICFMIVPGCIGRSTKFDIIYNPLIATTQPVGGLIQDGGLISVIVVLGGVIPIYMTSLTENITPDWVFGLVVLISTIYWPIKYCLNNNVKHLEERYFTIKEVYDSSDKENQERLNRQMKSLYHHLLGQNFLTLFSTVVYCFIPIIELSLPYFVQSSELKNNETSEATVAQYFIKNYIPNKKYREIK